MSTNGRRKGKDGENEIAGILRDLTGWSIKRRVRQHDGDSDLEGVPGWSVEVKRHATAARGEIRDWWSQAVDQAIKANALPVLFYRRDRDEWRAVWPVDPSLGASALRWCNYRWSVEGSVDAWAAVARENVEQALAALVTKENA